MTLNHLHMAKLCHRPRKCQHPTSEICSRLLSSGPREVKEVSGASEGGGGRMEEVVEGDFHGK